MARTERSWTSSFEEYMKMIANHPNYRGLPIERKRDGTLAWFAFAKGKVGKARIKWAEEKALELGLTIQPGVYAEVMRKIHPTKEHVCQTCGSHMSIYYHYPSANLIAAIAKAFGLKFSECAHISVIWEKILESGVSENELRRFFIHKFELPEITGLYPDEIKEQVRKNVQKQWNHDSKNGVSLVNIDDINKNGIIALCERMCRVGGKKLLSPGVMSNFPDRFDGFHTYNRCCRSTQDTGRSKENLKSYTRDRRAYEYWSDGNLHAANQFMGSQFFTGISADHIGPISLGFVHDPRYLRPMTSNLNSTKRDRLLVEDIEAVLAIEAATGIYPISWYSAKIWEFIKSNYKQHPNIVATRYRDMLKQNMVNFMFILKTILDEADIRGQQFLIREFIQPKYSAYFFHDYTFDKFGNILSKSERNFTARSDEELDRFVRIAFDSVYEYAEKENRNISPNLTENEQERLKHLCLLLAYSSFADCRELLRQLVDRMQSRLIQT